ncbi:MAG: hypothetical protein AAFX06_09300 [Planctomycetota bacterium]
MRGKQPTIEQFIRIATETESKRIILSGKGIKDGSSRFIWSLTNARTNRAFRNALRTSFGEEIMQAAARDFHLNGTDNLSSRKIQLVIEWAQADLRDQQIANSKAASTLPETERNGQRIFINRNPSNDIQSVLEAALAARRNAPNGVSRGGRHRGVYVSKGRASRTRAGIRNRAKKQFELVVELRQLGQTMFSGDDEMIEQFLDMVDRHVPAARFVPRRRMTQSDTHDAIVTIGKRIDELELNVDVLVHLLTIAKANAESRKTNSDGNQR